MSLQTEPGNKATYGERDTFKTQPSKFLATESKLKTKLSNKNMEVSNLKAQVSKLIE